ncbi:hypothetical protein DFH07DRAFT_772263 [Mycena maculata]|uniref:F-box domain-containing protein n=1 Tax=Mycena maculata TaxID=230809 RepID=A0AAD7NG96_9AGAR|nr:hypothetical protein DFH07DRAFT_772263 [Mycena maculata]
MPRVGPAHIRLIQWLTAAYYKYSPSPSGCWNFELMKRFMFPFEALPVITANTVILQIMKLEDICLNILQLACFGKQEGNFLKLEVTFRSRFFLISILHTNAVPSDEECQQIHNFLVGPQKAVAELTEELVRVQSLLDELTSKRDHINEFIHAHLALVGPVRRIPDDVVREIFVASLPSGENATLSGTKAPLLLCHISQGWRNLALSTPRLWTSLHIHAPPVSHPIAGSHKCHQINDAVKTWLSRSGSLPLSISFVAVSAELLYFPSDVSQEQVTETSESESSTILETLIQFSHRWRHIGLEMSLDHYFTPLAALSPSDVPILHSAVIGSINGAEVWNNLSFLGAITLDAVSLRHLGDVRARGIHWAGLSHLAVYVDRFQGDGPLSSSDALSILRQCPNLETCVLSTREHGIPSQVHSQPCHMTRLSRFSIHNGGHNLFQNLILPNLRLLQYTADFGGQPGKKLPLSPIFSSSNGLENLRLDVYNLSGDALIEILRIAPALRQLTVVGEPLLVLGDNHWIQDRDDRLVPLLTPIEGPDLILCPYLQSLTLLDFQALSDDALLAFILARTGPHLDHTARLSSIFIRFNRPRQVDIIPSLQQQITDGLEICLHHQPRSPTLDIPAHSVVDFNEPYSNWDPMATMWGSDMKHELVGPW